MCGVTPHSGHRSDVSGQIVNLLNNCSVVDNIHNATEQVWFSLAWIILFHLDSSCVAVTEQSEV